MCTLRTFACNEGASRWYANAEFGLRAFSCSEGDLFNFLTNQQSSTNTSNQFIFERNYFSSSNHHFRRTPRTVTRQVKSVNHTWCRSSRRNFPQVTSDFRHAIENGSVLRVVAMIVRTFVSFVSSSWIICQRKIRFEFTKSTIFWYFECVC